MAPQARHVLVCGLIEAVYKSHSCNETHLKRRKQGKFSMSGARSR